VWFFASIPTREQVVLCSLLSLLPTAHAITQNASWAVPDGRSKSGRSLRRRRRRRLTSLVRSSLEPVVTTIIVMQPTLGATNQKALARCAGTISSASIAYLVGEYGGRLPYPWDVAIISGAILAFTATMNFVSTSQDPRLAPWQYAFFLSYLTFDFLVLGEYHEQAGTDARSRSTPRDVAASSNAGHTFSNAGHVHAPPILAHSPARSISPHGTAARHSGPAHNLTNITSLGPQPTASIGSS